MEQPALPLTTIDSAPHRWPYFVLGVLSFFLGPALYFVQFQMRYFVTPWYVPMLSTLGVVLMAVSVGQRRGILRIVGTLVFAAVCALQWFMVAVAMKLPEYTGPVALGKEIPEFTATRADGQPFTNADLARGTPTVLIFFRGRW